MNRNILLSALTLGVMLGFSQATDDFSHTTVAQETLLQEKRRVESTYPEVLSLEDIRDTLPHAHIPEDDLKRVQELAKRSVYPSLRRKDPFKGYYFQSLPSDKRVYIAQLTLDYLLAKPNAENNYVYEQGEKRMVFGPYRYEKIVHAVMHHHDNEMEIASFLSWFFKKEDENIVKSQFVEQAIKRFKHRFFSYRDLETQQPLFLEPPFHEMMQEGIKGICPIRWKDIFECLMVNSTESYQEIYPLNPKSKELMGLKKNIWIYFAELLKQSPYWEDKHINIEEDLETVLRYLAREGVYKVRPRFSPRVKEMREYRGITVDELIEKHFPDQLQRMKECNPHHMEVLHKYGEKQKKKFEERIQKQKALAESRTQQVSTTAKHPGLKYLIVQ